MGGVARCDVSREEEDVVASCHHPLTRCNRHRHRHRLGRLTSPPTHSLAVPPPTATSTQPRRRFVEASAAEGKPYVGVLYAGFMLTAEGPSVLEFNCRFGDPETQVILPLLRDASLEPDDDAAAAAADADAPTDLYTVMLRCVRGALEPRDVRWKGAGAAAATVVVASTGYPDAYAKVVEMTWYIRISGSGLLTTTQ